MQSFIIMEGELGVINGGHIQDIVCVSPSSSSALSSPCLPFCKSLNFKQQCTVCSNLSVAYVCFVDMQV